MNANYNQPKLPPTDFTSLPWDSASLVTLWHAVRHLWNEEALHKFSGDVVCTIFRCKAEDKPLTLWKQFSLAARGTGEGDKKTNSSTSQSG